jgi:hypothetical protein
MNVFEIIEKKALERGLDFVLIGGFAVIQHGHSRFTMMP